MQNKHDLMRIAIEGFIDKQEGLYRKYSCSLKGDNHGKWGVGR